MIVKRFNLRKDKNCTGRTRQPVDGLFGPTYHSECLSLAAL